MGAAVGTGTPNIQRRRLSHRGSGVAGARVSSPFPDPNTSSSQFTPLGDGSNNMKMTSLMSLLFDFLSAIGTIGATLLIEFLIPPRSVFFDLKDPSLQRPMLDSIVPTSYLLIGSVILTLLVFLLIYRPLILRPRALLRSAAPFLLGAIESGVYTVFITVVLKILIGRARPYFSKACGSYVPNPNNLLCTGVASEVKEARKSFPSGHSSFAFAIGVYLSRHASSALGLFEVGTYARAWRLVIAAVPVVGAALVAATRIIDYHHHYADTVAGSLIGAFIAYVVFDIRMASSGAAALKEGMEDDRELDSMTGEDEDIEAQTASSMDRDDVQMKTDMV